MRLIALAVVTLFFCTVIFAEDDCPKDEKVLFCYLSSWSVYRENEGKFTIDDIDPHMCTHLVYAFAGLSMYGGIESFDPTYDITNGAYKQFVGLKEKNPCLKTLLAIGGWNQGSRPFSVMVSDEAYRTSFIESVLRLVAVYGFDGLDIDWEYPVERGGIPEDKANFGKLLVEMKAKLKLWDLLLTIAVPSSIPVAEKAYDMEAIKSSVDYVLIMGYDITPTNSEKTGLISPMTEITNIVKFWTSQEDMPKEKIVLGVPAYGRTFTLKDTTQTGLEAPTAGPGKAGYFTKESGFLSYYEVILHIQSDRYKVVSVEGEENYYAFLDDQWISYETADNYKAKANYALEQGIGGIMVWSIDTDDFKKQINDTEYPIVNAIKEVLLTYK